MEEGEEKKTSKYSSGVNIIIRLDDLWKKTHAFAIAGQYSKWNSALDRVWLELARDYKKKDTDWTTKESDFKKFDTDLETNGGFHDKQPEGFKKAPPDIMEKRDKTYKVLMDKQLFLARLENELGKGTTHSEGEEYDFD